MLRSDGSAWGWRREEIGMFKEMLMLWSKQVAPAVARPRPHEQTRSLRLEELQERTAPYFCGKML